MSEDPRDMVAEAVSQLERIADAIEALAQRPTHVKRHDKLQLGNAREFLRARRAAELILRTHQNARRLVRDREA